MELEVESAGVADGFTLRVTAPQCRRRRAAIGAGQTGSAVATAARLSITNKKKHWRNFKNMTNLE